jgi:hypothetical protein
VKVSASGFLAGSEVELYIHSAPILLNTTTADGGGDIEIEVFIPSTIAAGVHHIEATGLDPSLASLSLQQAIDVMALPETDTASPSASEAPSPSGRALFVIGIALLVAGIRGGRGSGALRRLVGYPR